MKSKKKKKRRNKKRRKRCETKNQRLSSCPLSAIGPLVVDFCPSPSDFHGNYGKILLLWV